ncbi:hypothetical protein H5410_031259 [Solanum commersonii]|uniref:Uncharacterized protein n=1 Tax=Solanum commersonii TaxID=4109 RepID=A0A9J5YHX7_SOLCO|nr:hypothetical protein H5410_031259 [Solanum commersonii]
MKNGIGLKLGSSILIAEDLNSISQEFYKTCALHNQIMYFVPWFITTYLPLYINIIERIYKDGNSNLTKAIYPPQSSFVVLNNTGITFSAFQKYIEEDIASISIAEINKLITQNNYLSLYVKVLGEHISFLDKKLDDLTILIKDIKADMAKENPLSGLKFNPIDLSQDFADRMETTDDFKNHVSSEFNKLRGYPKKNSCYATKPNMNTYYYPHPTLQDVLIEDCDWNQTNTSYSGSEIYEWNLDGLSDRHLTILVH